METTSLTQSPSPTISPRPNDDETWYVNIYFQDEGGRTIRETLADGLTEPEAGELSDVLNRFANKLTYFYAN